MKIERVQAEGLPEPAGRPWSNCLVVGPWIFLSGVTAGTADGDVVGDDMESQATEVFRKISALLQAAGAELGDIVKLVIYVTDIEDRDGFSRVRGGLFGDSPIPPCSTLVEVSRFVDERLLLEVDVTAVRPSA